MGDTAQWTVDGFSVARFTLSNEKRVRAFRNRVNRKTIQYARNLRKNQTPSERRLYGNLWGHLDERLHRQHIILGWIADFYIASARLVIEVDGSSHDDSRERDDYRDQVMVASGFSVLRLDAEFVMSDVRSAVDIVFEVLQNIPCQRAIPQSSQSQVASSKISTDNEWGPRYGPTECCLIGRRMLMEQ